MGRKKPTPPASLQRAWIDLCGYEPKYSGAIPVENRARANLIGVRLALHRWACATRHIAIKPIIYIQPGTDPSVERAVRTLFWSDANPRTQPEIKTLPVDANGAIDAKKFAGEVQRDRYYHASPMLAVATFGTDRDHAVDPLADMIAVCRRNDMWLHIDASSHGGLLANPKVAEKYKSAFAHSDSVAVPGLFLTRFPSRLERCTGVKADAVADFNKAAQDYTKTLEKEAAKDMKRRNAKPLITKLGL
jgi:hypothetical protein